MFKHFFNSFGMIFVYYMCGTFCVRKAMKLNGFTFPEDVYIMVMYSRGSYRSFMYVYTHWRSIVYPTKNGQMWLYFNMYGNLHTCDRYRRPTGEMYYSM